MKLFTKARLLPLVLTALVILLDQASKALIVILAPIPGRGPLYRLFGGDFIEIWHVRNKAIAFSIGQNLPDSLRFAMFIVIPILVLGLLMYYYFTSTDLNNFQCWCIAGIVGGGLGNIIDRIFRPNGVVDFISVNLYGLLGMSRWPTFNVADSAVVVCGILLLINILFSEQKRGPKHE